jgi:hypothetical protein
MTIMTDTPPAETQEEVVPQDKHVVPLEIVRTDVPKEDDSEDMT